MTPSSGKEESRLLIVIGLIASVVTIFVFVTGVPSLRQLFLSLLPRTDTLAPSGGQAPHPPQPPAQPMTAKRPEPIQPPEIVLKEPTPPTEPTPVKSPETTSTAALPRRGIFPVGREFKQMTGIGNGIVHLYNIEIIDGRLLRFNFDFNWDVPPYNSNPVDVYLDNPVDTTFLLDRLGRQHALAQATEISAERPMGVPPRSSKRFTLTFSFPSDMESFKYQVILLVRIKDLLGTAMGSIMSDQFRLHIRAEKEINLTDFQ